MVKVISFVMKGGAPQMEVYEDTAPALKRHKELMEDKDCVQLKVCNATFIGKVMPAKRVGGFGAHVACAC